MRRSTSRSRHPNPITLCYELDAHADAAAGRSPRQFYAKVYRDGASALAATDPSTVHLPALDMVLWPWPADPGLPQLPALLDPAQARRFWDGPAHSVQSLRYVPEGRATLRYSRPARDSSVQQLFVKTFSDERGSEIHRRFMHFWRQARLDAQAPTVAEPLVYDAGLRAFWQDEAVGVPLMQQLGAAPCPGWLPRKVAAAWAALHAAPAELAGPAPRSRAHWLAEVARRSRKIARAAPELAERAARLAQTIERSSQQLHEPAPTLIHGDCHPDQLWVDGRRIVLFDFDEFALGDPMEDLAAFGTKLDQSGVDARFAVTMLAEYASLASHRFSLPRLRWHMAVQQLLQASRAFVFQIADWRAELERRLERAQALADTCTERCCA